MAPLDRELNSLYVGAEYRSTGVGRSLLLHAVGNAGAVLWVFEANPRAQSFYRRLGLHPDGARMVDPDTGLWELRFVRVQ